VLRLLAYTALKFPGVFYQGRAADVVCVIGRILPFLAEPNFRYRPPPIFFSPTKTLVQQETSLTMRHTCCILCLHCCRSRHELIFNALWNLLSVLRQCDREAYRNFFMDAMVAVEGVHFIPFSLVTVHEFAKLRRKGPYLTLPNATDVLDVASMHDESPNGVPPGRLLVKCLCGSFSDVQDSPGIFSELPDSCRPKNGPGVLVDLSGHARWLPFATSFIKLVNKCLTDGTLYVDGLVNMPFVYAACSILCYGDESLHKVGVFKLSCHKYIHLFFGYTYEPCTHYTLVINLVQQVCYDFVRIVATVMTVDILPVQDIIRSITCILSQDVTELSDFRYTIHFASGCRHYSFRHTLFGTL
jgi:serine/threonine-protein kinase ATR